MTIEWIKCSERMPPDDKFQLFILWDGYQYDIASRCYHIYSGRQIDDYVDYSDGCTKEWTPFTLEKWHELNK